VHLPQGTVVKVLVNKKFLNVWVQASAAEYNNTQGTLDIIVLFKEICVAESQVKMKKTFIERSV
jgi:hypothetical protein